MGVVFFVFLPLGKEFLPLGKMQKKQSLNGIVPGGDSPNSGFKVKKLAKFFFSNRKIQICDLGKKIPLALKGKIS
jgi:hypothetical protein